MYKLKKEMNLIVMLHRSSLPISIKICLLASVSYLRFIRSRNKISILCSYCIDVLIENLRKSEIFSFDFPSIGGKVRNSSQKSKIWRRRQYLLIYHTVIRIRLQTTWQKLKFEKNSNIWRASINTSLQQQLCPSKMWLSEF